MQYSVAMFEFTAMLYVDKDIGFIVNAKKKNKIGNKSFQVEVALNIPKAVILGPTARSVAKNVWQDTEVHNSSE